VAPVGSWATTTSPTGSCATGWTSCGLDVGGNCCPSGWACGTASCSSVGASQTSVLQKGEPSLGVKNRGVRLGWVIGLVLTILLR